MKILIVYGTQFGTTGALARDMAAALERDHAVAVMHERDARQALADGIDLLIYGAPTQFGGRRLLGRPFLKGLRRHGFAGVAAAAFDTRMAGEAHPVTSVIAGQLRDAGCRLVLPPEGFFVADMKGPMAPGEEVRARAWAHDVAVAARAAADRPMTTPARTPVPVAS